MEPQYPRYPNPELHNLNPDYYSPFRRVVNMSARIILATALVLADKGIDIAMLAHRTNDPLRAVETALGYLHYGYVDDQPCIEMPEDPIGLARQALSLPSDIALEEAQAAAVDRSLTFVSPDERSEIFNQFAYKPPESRPTPAQAIDLINQFTQRNFGVQTYLDLPQAILDDPDTAAALTLDLAQFVWVMSLLPRELVAKLPFDTIFIDNGIAERHLGGELDVIDRELHLDYTIIKQPFTLIHEAIGHGIHNLACNNYPIYDSDFQAMNPDDFRYQPCEEEACLEGDHIVTGTRYGAISVNEDFTIVLQQFMTAERNPADYFQTDIMLYKLGLALYRLEWAAPGSTEYFAAIRPILVALDAAA